MTRWIAIFFVRIFTFLCYRHKVYGKENFPKGGGIIASNHCSFLDPPLIGISCPDKVHFLARESLFHPPLFAALLRSLNTHPIQRGKENVTILRKIMELLEKQSKVMIFPEGHRSPNGELQEGQLGVGMLVQQSHCIVIPVYVYGTFEAWNSKRRFPKLKGKTACVIGSPLDFSDLESANKKEARQEIVDRIMGAIIKLREWYSAGAKGSPP